MNFDELNLSAPLLRAVAEAGYTQPSPIQAKAIPPVLQGRDLMGCAQTGTGKTAAFALPMLQLLAARRPQGKKVRALILTPTRELALQIGQSFADYGKYVSVSHTVIFGGVGQQPQVAALQRGVDILVACPGRLNDLIGQGFVDLSALEIFVLDEADRMLDMGFVHDVKRVIAKLPKQRQNLMFSATMPKEIEELAGSILHQPVSVKVDPVSSTVERIEQKLYFVEKKQKVELLTWLLRDPGITNALVFSRTKHGADKIARVLTKAGIPAAAIHGNKSQSARVSALEGFKEGRTRVLVATDIAARGIDISELSHVFNYDLPEVPETYVHRIGRTARAGADGVAISFCATEEREYLAGIEKLNRKKIPVVSDHPWAGIAPAPAPTVVPAPSLRPAARTARKAALRAEMPAGSNAPEKKQPVRAVAPAPARKEEFPLEKEQEHAGQEAGLSASAKRRRRRRRAQDRVTDTPAAVPAPKREAARPAPKRDPEEKRPQPAARREAAAPKREQPQPRAAARTEQPNREGRRRKPQRTEPAPRPGDNDPGLLLISRKPPVQKFASFDDYMSAHGGATAPILSEEEGQNQ